MGLTRVPMFVRSAARFCVAGWRGAALEAIAGRVGA